MSEFKWKTVKVEDGRSEVVTFDNNIEDFEVVIADWEVAYPNGADHHIKRLKVDVSGKESGVTGVEVSATCYVTDNSNHRGSGSIKALVFAVVES